jgi:hypothetical protein
MLLIAKRAICRGIYIFQNESTPKVGPETAVEIEEGPKRPMGRPTFNKGSLNDLQRLERLVSILNVGNLHSGPRIHKYCIVALCVTAHHMGWY